MNLRSASNNPFRQGAGQPPQQRAPASNGQLEDSYPNSEVSTEEAAPPSLEERVAGRAGLLQVQSPFEELESALDVASRWEPSALDVASRWEPSALDVASRWEPSAQFEYVADQGATPTSTLLSVSSQDLNAAMRQNGTGSPLFNAFSPEEARAFWNALLAPPLQGNRSAQPLNFPERPYTTVRASPVNPVHALSEALELGADLFTQFNETHDLSLLATLVKRALKESKSSHLKPMLRRLVEEMAAKPPLAERVFAALKGGDERCDDRVSFTLHQAELALLVQPAMEGVLTKEQMFHLARKVFRRTCIDQLAKDKVKEINADRRVRGVGEHLEEIETHLAYYSELHESLELGGEKPYGRFISSPISGVESKDISAAMRAVLDREGKELWGFFATWEPWQAVLRDKYPNEVDEIENAIADGNYWKNIEREVQNDLENRAVPSALRPAALTQELKQRGQDKQRELWLALTMKAWKDQDA
jgi:hypothetical protein